MTLAETKSFFEGEIVRNASSLYGTTIVTSALGFIYWFVAARMVSPRVVGLASAAQSAAAFLSIVCVLGLSTLLISELAKDRSPARSLMLTASIVVSVVALVVTPLVGMCLQHFSLTLRQAMPGFIGLLVLTALTSLTSVALVLDDACIGLLRGDIQLKRNAVFSISKLLLLPILIEIWPSHSGTELVIAWLFGVMFSLVTMATQLRALTADQSGRFVFSTFLEKRRIAVGHHWLNLAIFSPRMVFPVLVATIVGSRANAGFTVALLVVSIATVIPYHLSTALFALAPGDETALRREIRKTMRFCLFLAVGSALFFAIFSHLILGFFGRSYENATAALVVLGLTTYPSAIKFHYVAIARVRGRMQRAAFLAMIGAIFEVGMAAVGGELRGETGVAIGIAMASLMECALFSPAVFRIIRNRDVTNDGETTRSDNVDGTL